MKSTLLIATVIALTSGSHARADLSVNGTLSDETNAFGPSEGGVLAEASILVDSLGTFDVDFDLLGDVDFSVTWQAPAGQAIEIAVPDGFTFYSLFLRFRTEGIFFNPGTEANPFDVSVFGESGDTLPAPYTSLRFSDPGGTIANAFISYEIVPGQTYRFTSLTATGTVPAAYNVDFDNVAVQDFAIFGQAASLDTGLTSPGQWVRLVSVPESSSLTRVGLGGLGLLRRRRTRDAY